MKATSSRRAAITGAFLIAAYLIGAALSGRLSPLARLPLLDGVHGAQPYRWVSPPPDQAQSNQAPAPATERLALGAKGSPQRIVTTPDQQVSLSLPAEAIKPSAGKRSAEIKIEPLDPVSIGATPPGGFEFFGNAYRVVIRYVPGGTAVPQIVPAGNITLLYPAIPPDRLGTSPAMAFSADGRSWRKIDAQIQHATQQANTPVNDTGYFAAVLPPAEPGAAKGKPFPWVIVVVIVASIGIVVGTFYRISRTRAERRRREQKREAMIRRSRSTRKRRR